VSNRDVCQKEVTVSSCDGKFPKNEVIIHLTGLDPDFDIKKLVEEVVDRLAELQKKTAGGAV
jgi:hypothetical protein